jgi:hypothetical protein
MGFLLHRAPDFAIRRMGLERVAHGERVPVLRGWWMGRKKCGSLGTSIILRVLEESAPFDQLGSIASTGAEIVQVRGTEKTCLAVELKIALLHDSSRPRN